MAKRAKKIAEAVIEEREGKWWLDLRLALCTCEHRQRTRSSVRLLPTALLAAILLALVVAILLLWERDPMLGRLFLSLLASIFGQTGS